MLDGNLYGLTKICKVVSIYVMWFFKTVAYCKNIMCVCALQGFHFIIIYCTFTYMLYIFHIAEKYFTFYDLTENDFIDTLN